MRQVAIRLRQRQARSVSEASAAASQLADMTHEVAVRAKARASREEKKARKHSCAEMLPTLKLRLAEMFAFRNRP